MKIGDKEVETGPVMLVTRCECKRVFKEMPLLGEVVIHMVTSKTKQDKKGFPTDTEQRVFVKTGIKENEHHIYKELMP